MEFAIHRGQPAAALSGVSTTLGTFISFLDFILFHCDPFQKAQEFDFLCNNLFKLVGVISSEGIQ
jgi:hypothetical protein